MCARDEGRRQFKQKERVVSFQRAVSTCFRWWSVLKILVNEAGRMTDPKHEYSFEGQVARNSTYIRRRYLLAEFQVLKEVRT